MGAGGRFSSRFGVYVANASVRVGFWGGGLTTHPAPPANVTEAQDVPRPVFFLIYFVCRFWCRFGWQKGSILGPQSEHFSIKIHPTLYACFDDDNYELKFENKPMLKWLDVIFI